MRTKLTTCRSNNLNSGNMRTTMRRQRETRLSGSTPSDGNFRILENDDFRILENGDFRILE